MHPMEFQGYVVMWNVILVRLEIVLVLVQDRCMVCSKHAIASEIVSNYLMELLGDVGHVKSHFGLFGDSVHFGAR
jgi:hypothetical protein